MNRGLVLLAAVLLWATHVLAGTIRIDNVVREIEWCEEIGETLRYAVQGVVYWIPKKDAEVTDLVCRKAEPARRGSSPLPASDFPFTPYLRQLHDQVSTRWTPPRGANAGLSAVIFLEIGRDGNLVGDPLVEKTSGMTHFDDSALRAVKQAQPFAPLPVDFRGKSLRVHFGFDRAKHQGPAR